MNTIITNEDSDITIEYTDLDNGFATRVITFPDGRQDKKTLLLSDANRDRDDFLLNYNYQAV